MTFHIYRDKYRECGQRPTNDLASERLVIRGYR